MRNADQVSIPIGNSSTCVAMIVRPEGDGPFPAVLLLHDVLGFTDDLIRIAHRFADAGYVALAPDLFGTGRKPICIVRTMRALAARDGYPFDALDGAQQWLAEEPDVDATKIGAVGFCLGGGFAVLHACGSDLAFVGAFYGEVPADVDDLRGMPPCFAGYGEQDRIFRAHGRRLKTSLDELGVPNDVRIYDDVGHSYMNQLEGVLGRLAAYTPMRARYDETAAEDSWAAMLAFFAQHLNNGSDDE